MYVRFREGKSIMIYNWNFMVGTFLQELWFMMLTWNTYMTRNRDTVLITEPIRDSLIMCERLLFKDTAR